MSYRPAQHNSGPRPAERNIKAVVIGCSAGGLDALRVLLGAFPAGLGVAVIVVAHTSANGDYLLPQLLAGICRLPVNEAKEREPVLSGRVYLAPPNYHLLIEPDLCFALSVDERVCFVRPAIDVLFRSAADAYRRDLVGVILTGANSDGAQGIKAVKEAGGHTLAQEPSDAYADTMPKAAIATGAVDWILPLDLLAERIIQLCPLH